MKRILILLLGSVFLFGAARFGYNTLSKSQKSALDTTVEADTDNSAAIDFTVVDSDGNNATLSQYSHKPVIINFWATWCQPCRSELQSFNELYQEYGQAVQFMMVNTTDGSRDTVKSVKTFLKEYGYSFPVYYDINHEAIKAYGVYSIPMTVIIDQDGNVVTMHIGTMDKDTIKSYIEEVLK